MPVRVVEIETSRGPARATAHLPPGRSHDRHVLVLVLHGAGTDTSRPPLPEMCDELSAAGVAAVRFDQPYRVAGRRAPDPAHLLDRMVIEGMPRLRSLAAPNAWLGVVGRSSGARVACRIAGELGVEAIACLGFPYQPPARRGGARPADRGDELAMGARVCPVLVVQGDRDPFGIPPTSTGAEVLIEPAAGHLPTPAMARHAVAWLRTMSGVGARP